MFLVTSEARAWQAAEAEKRRKRQQGGTPAHAMADGHAEFHDEERRRREDALKDRHDTRHPQTGQFTTATAWPGTDAHTEQAGGARLMRVGDPQAPQPEPLATVTDTFSADALGRLVHPGSAAVQQLPVAGTFPVPVISAPSQLPFHTAPTGSTS